MDLTSELTICIKTFERPQCCARAITSIEEFCPKAKILVCDDSFTRYTYQHSANVIYTESDIGASEGRNKLIDNVQTKYMMLMDDDGFLIKNTQLEKTLDIFESELTADFFIIPVRSYTCFNTYIDIKNKIFLRKKIGAKKKYNGIHLIKSDISQMNFIGYSDVFKKIKFDSNLLIGGEVTDFFLRALLLDTIYFTFLDFSIGHKKLNTPYYRKIRHSRRKKFQKEFIKKWGFKGIGHTRSDNITRFDVFNSDHHSYRGKEWGPQK